MTNIPIQIQFVKSLTSAKPSRIVAVKPDGSSTFELYVTDKKGAIFPIKDTAGFGGITDITSDGSTIIVTENGTEKNLEIDPAILSLIYSSLQPNDNISELNNDSGFITIDDVPTIDTSNLVPYTGATQDVVLGLNSLDANSINLNAITTPTHERGTVYFDNTNDCISFMDSISNTSVQVGYEVLIRARNNTGVTIPNGSVVYISDAIGQISTIALAKADTLETSNLIGVVTHDILNNTIGKVCVFGLVNDLNLSSFDDGDILYLSENVAGGFTTTPPTNYVVQVGVIEHAHTTHGKLLVQPKSPLNNILSDSQKIAPTEFAVKTYIDNKDLADFTNTSLDPFARISDIGGGNGNYIFDTNSVSATLPFGFIILKEYNIGKLSELNIIQLYFTLKTLNTPADGYITIIDSSNNIVLSNFLSLSAANHTYNYSREHIIIDKLNNKIKYIDIPNSADTTAQPNVLYVNTNFNPLEDYKIRFSIRALGNDPTILEHVMINLL